jgi:hypothetical protein
MPLYSWIIHCFTTLGRQERGQSLQTARYSFLLLTRLFPRISADCFTRLHDGSVRKKTQRCRKQWISQFSHTSAVPEMGKRPVATDDIPKPHNFCVKSLISTKGGHTSTFVRPAK